MPSSVMSTLPRPACSRPRWSTKIPRRSLMRGLRKPPKPNLPKPLKPIVGNRQPSDELSPVDGGCVEQVAEFAEEARAERAVVWRADGEVGGGLIEIHRTGEAGVAGRAQHNDVVVAGVVGGGGCGIEAVEGVGFVLE